MLRRLLSKFTSTGGRNRGGRRPAGRGQSGRGRGGTGASIGAAAEKFLRRKR